MIRSAAFLIVLLTCSFAFADPPKAVITGPTEGVPGDLIELDSSESVGTKMKWYVEPARFADGKATFKLSKDGASIWLASRPQIYRVELIVSNEEGPDRAVFTVTITGGSPTPPVPPKPPDPVNPLPADKFGLGEWVRSQVLANTPVEKRYLCTQFAGNFTQVKVAPFASFVDAMNRVAALNKTTQGADKATWDKVFSPLVAQLKSLISGKVLNANDLAEVRAALEAIAVGFAGAGVQ